MITSLAWQSANTSKRGVEISRSTMKMGKMSCPLVDKPLLLKRMQVITFVVFIYRAKTLKDIWLIVLACFKDEKLVSEKSHII